MKRQVTRSSSFRALAVAVILTLIAASAAEAGKHWLYLVNGHFAGGATSRWTDDDENPTIYADTPPAGQVFDTWSPNGPYAYRYIDGANSTTTRFNMPNDTMTVTAIYKSINPSTHVLSVGSGGGDGNYANGAIAAITANPPQSGKAFDKWTGANASRFGDIYSATTTFSMPDEDASITATYKDEPVYFLDTHGGNPDAYFAEGTVVNLQAHPAPAGFVFDRWTWESGEADASMFGDIYSAGSTFIMPGHEVDLYANYKPANQSTTTTTTTTSTTTTTVPPGTTTTTTTTTTTSTTSTTIPPAPAAMQKTYSIVSVGTVRGQARIVQVYGLKRKTWAQFALWSDSNGSIYFKAGETFYGRVHSNDKLWFEGDPEFFAPVTSGSSTYGGSTNACVFHEGFQLGAATDTMARVEFSSMRDAATLTLTGRTDIAFNGTNMLITNPYLGWTNHNYALNNSTVIAVCGPGTNGLPTGTVNVGGLVDGRVTVVAECDINITNHITYADDPKTNALSDDAVGLIANRDIVVKPGCPNNLKIYAHMMATGNLTSTDTDGSFGVEGYDSGSPRGVLSVHGGIVQNVRGAVGQFSGSTTVHGFDKNYTYDTRFATSPPPEYPPLLDELTFDKWRDL